MCQNGILLALLIQPLFRKSRKNENQVHRLSTNDRAAFFHKKLGTPNRVIVQNAKRRGCTDCGGLFAGCVMDFDHLNASTKSFDVCTCRGRSTVKVLEEIAKCDLVCANCHRVRTARRRQGLPATLPSPDYEI